MLLRTTFGAPPPRPAAAPRRLPPCAGHNRDPGVHDRRAPRRALAGPSRPALLLPPRRRPARLSSAAGPLLLLLLTPALACRAAAPLPHRVHSAAIHVHGRHVDVTPELEAHVKGRLAPIIDKFRSPAILESEGGVRDVDVRLMCAAGAHGPARAGPRRA